MHFLDVRFWSSSVVWIEQIKRFVLLIDHLLIAVVYYIKRMNWMLSAFFTSPFFLFTLLYNLILIIVPNIWRTESFCCNHMTYLGLVLDWNVWKFRFLSHWWRPLNRNIQPFCGMICWRFLGTWRNLGRDLSHWYTQIWLYILVALIWLQGIFDVGSGENGTCSESRRRNCVSFFGGSLRVNPIMTLNYWLFFRLYICVIHPLEHLFVAERTQMFYFVPRHVHNIAAKSHKRVTRVKLIFVGKL